MQHASGNQFNVPADVLPSPLVGLYRLPHKVTLIIPSTTHGGGEATASQVAEAVQAASGLFAEWFGDFTITDGIGGRVDAAGKRIVEPVVLVTAFASEEAFTNHLPDVVGVARWVCDEMGQQAVAVEVDGSLYFVTADMALTVN